MPSMPMDRIKIATSTSIIVVPRTARRRMRWAGWAEWAQTCMECMDWFKDSQR